MAKTSSSMTPLGSEAPFFNLVNIDQKFVALNDFDQSKGLLVMFICNHCPYVKHINKQLVQLAHDYQPKGLAFVAINSNDVEKYPDDHPDKMKEVHQLEQYPFPYLFDQDQNVAKKFQATCTPDFFFYGPVQKGKRFLLYRGRLDGSTPGNGVVNDGKDIRQAFEFFLAGQEISKQQLSSLGCNIKWKN